MCRNEVTWQAIYGISDCTNISFYCNSFVDRYCVSADEQFILKRVADAAIDIYAMTVSISRASRSAQDKKSTAEYEAKLVNTFCHEVRLVRCNWSHIRIEVLSNHINCVFFISGGGRDKRACFWCESSFFVFSGRPACQPESGLDAQSARCGQLQGHVRTGQGNVQRGRRGAGASAWILNFSVNLLWNYAGFFSVCSLLNRKTIEEEIDRQTVDCLPGFVQTGLMFCFCFKRELSYEFLEILAIIFWQICLRGIMSRKKSWLKRWRCRGAVDRKRMTFKSWADPRANPSWDRPRRRVGDFRWQWWRGISSVPAAETPHCSPRPTSTAVLFPVPSRSRNAFLRAILLRHYRNIFFFILILLEWLRTYARHDWNWKLKKFCRFLITWKPGLSIYQSSKQSIDQSIDESNNQSMNQAISRSIEQLMYQPKDIVSSI